MGVAAATLQRSATTKKVLIEFPENLLDQAGVLADELDLDRSKLIRHALERYLQTYEQQKLEEELALAYRANSDLALRICKEYSSLDGDSV